MPSSATAPPPTKAVANGTDGRDSSNKPAKLRKTSAYSQTAASKSSLGQENASDLRPTPTLRARRRDYDPSLPRQKSGKRKTEEYAREREVRAMSQPIPIPKLKRPVTYSGGPLNRDTKMIPGDMNKRLGRPASQVSLPLPDSISENEDYSQQNSFKIGFLAALGPRPTVRYDSSPRTSAGKRRLQTKPSFRDIIQEEPPTSTKRIDDLADDLDSSALRELMEKDRRRRERKKDYDGAKLQEKLEKRAKRQREEEANRGRQTETEAFQPPSTGPSGTAGTGIASTPAGVPTTAERKETKDGGPRESQLPQQAALEDQQTTQPAPQTAQRQVHPSPIRNPFEDEVDDESPEDPFSHPEDAESEPVLPVRSPLRVAQPQVQAVQRLAEPQTLSPPSSPIPAPEGQKAENPPLKQVQETTPIVSEKAGADLRASDQSEPHASSWTTFFKRGGRRKRSSADPAQATPEFSNTSRESFSKRNPPPVVPPRSYLRTESGIPQRTMSKFREDLPELPLSPPDSRVQSPETTAAPSSILASTTSRKQSQSLSGTLDGKSVATSSNVPAPDHATSERPVTGTQSIDADPAIPHVAQSLASVDSEGSWLSGKPPKRSSAQSYQGRVPSRSSLQHHPSPSAEVGEEEDLTNDEYFNRLTPAPEDRRESSASALRKPSSTLMDLEQMRDPSSSQEAPALPVQSDERWHGSVGRQAQVVRQAPRAKSKEGLLKEYTADDGASSIGSSDIDDEAASIHGGESPAEEFKDSPVMRAKSVEYKGHARHISAGSARLLDIRRASTVSERSGTENPNRASTSRLSASLKPDEANTNETK